jgi:hypothetical protein
VIRPLSLESTVLHAWPEYYDHSFGWLMIDPTWENTTGGIDYFTKNDLNHFVLYIESDPLNPLLVPDDVSVNFSDEEFNGNSDAKVEVSIPNEIYSGFPSTIRIKIDNQGNFSYPNANFLLKTDRLGVKGEREFIMPVVPPYGFLEYEFDIYTNSIWDSYEDEVIIQIGNKNINKPVIVKPFIAFGYFSPVIMVIIFFMVLIYGGIFYWNLKNPKFLKKLVVTEEADK